MKAGNVKSPFFIKIVVLVLLMLLIVSACSGSSSTPSPLQVGSRPLQVGSRQTPPQQFPQGLLTPNRPVLDRMFGYRCGVSVYRASPHYAMAVTGDGWVIPETGEIVTGSNNSCDVTTLSSIAHQYGAKGYLTLGVDASQHSPWQLASYLKRAVDTSGLLDRIVQKAKQGRYDGVILDYETVDANFPTITKIFQEYCIKLRLKLQAQIPALKLGIDIIHKTGDNDSFHKLNAFEDWRLLGQDTICDFFVLMSMKDVLDPGPLVEWSWINAQLQYLEQTMPQALPKTIWLFPAYGAKWQQNSDGSWAKIDGDVSCPYAMNIVTHNVTILKKAEDPPMLEYTYTDSHGQIVHRQVWYNTTSSLINLMTQLQKSERDLLRNQSFKLPVSFWYRGDECSDLDSQLATFYA
jgi:hypothetical protein